MPERASWCACFPPRGAPEGPSTCRCASTTSSIRSVCACSSGLRCALARVAGALLHKVHRRRLSIKVCAPSRSNLSRTSSLARISLLTGWCVVLAARGQLGRQANVEILDKLWATHRRLSLEADLRVATGAAPCAADGSSAPFGARANGAAQGHAACSREGAYATAHVRVALVLRMGLVGQPVDQHSASPCASVCVLLALSRGGAGVVQYSTFGSVCCVHGRVSDCVGVHVCVQKKHAMIVRVLVCPVESARDPGCSDIVKTHSLDVAPSVFYILFVIDPPFHPLACTLTRGN